MPGEAPTPSDLHELLATTAGDERWIPASTYRPGVATQSRSRSPSPTPNERLVLEAADAAFARLDKNGDGRIDRAEWRAAVDAWKLQQQPQQQQRRRQPPPAFPSTPGFSTPPVSVPPRSL